MKQLLYVLLPLTMCMLASCGKEEEVVPESDPAPPVVRYAEYETTADYVDFGVGNFMIATRNLGAKRPEDTGYFFVWGEFPSCGDYCGCRRNLLLDLRLANRCQPDSHLLFYPPVF